MLKQLARPINQMQTRWIRVSKPKKLLEIEKSSNPRKIKQGLQARKDRVEEKVPWDQVI